MILGIDVGGTSLKAGVFDDAYNLEEKFQIFYNNWALSDEFPDYLIKEIINIWNLSENKYGKIHSLGCGVPGVVSNDGVIAVAPNMKGIINFPIKSILENQINASIEIDNDANAAALAELVLGSGRLKKNFIYVTLGTGIGGAIISDGKLFRGSSGGAGEIGHCIIDYQNSRFDTRPYRIGTIEVLSGREGILRLANEIATSYPESKLNQLDNFDVKDISESANLGDFAATEIIKITAKRIATALATTANILDIPEFIIGGGISKSKLLLQEIKNNLVQISLPSLSNRIDVLPAKFIEDTGIYGAAVLSNIYKKESNSFNNKN